MGILLVILAGIIGIVLTAHFFRKNLRIIRAKNENEKSSFKRGSNYALTVLWFSYMFVFFIGLIVNNLIFTGN